MILLNHKKSTLAVLIATVAVSHTGAYAEPEYNPTAKTLAPSEEIFVTAARAEQSIHDVMGSASIITEQDIFNVQPYDLNDMFELQAGVDVLRTGSRGSTASVQVRGASSAQTLMLVNGMRISSATLGVANYSLIPPELVAKVELLRGSASSLYGSDAIGGVFNISTHANAGTKTGVRAGVEYGSHNYHRAAIVGNVNGQALDAAVAVVRERSEGINSIISDNTRDNIADDDGYERLGGVISLNYKLNEDAEVKVLSLTNSGESEYDSSFNIESLPYSDQKLSVHQLAVTQRVNAFYKTDFMIGRSTDELNVKEDNPALTPFPSEFKTTNQTVSWLNEFNVYGQVVVVGYDNVISKVSGSGNYIDKEGDPISRRQSQAGFIQVTGGIARFGYALGVRHDDVGELGQESTPNVAVSFDFGGGHTLYSRYAEGFRTPTFNDAFYPYGGNPNLEPEESENVEVGYKLALSSVSLALAAYTRDVTNLIEWVPQADTTWAPINVGKASFEGVELTLDVALGFLGHLTLATDYLEALDTTTEEKPLDNHAEKTLRMSWLKTLGPVSLGLQSKVQSGRKVSTDIDPSGYSAGYGILNVTAAYQVSNVWSVQAKVGNAFDKAYTLNPAYHEDGRNWQLAFKAAF